jgi:cytochrome b involved in lipid metabolism
MLDYAGADGTHSFMYKPHSNEAVKMLEKYLIGELARVILIFNLVFI